jgi:hypothetical protein
MVGHVRNELRAWVAFVKRKSFFPYSTYYILGVEGKMRKFLRV